MRPLIDKKVPVRILSSNSGVVEAEAGAQYSLIRKTDGSAWSFGDNWHGQLADGQSTKSQSRTLSISRSQCYSDLRQLVHRLRCFYLMVLCECGEQTIWGNWETVASPIVTKAPRSISSGVTQVRVTSGSDHYYNPQE